jgi:excinuclease UvrABC nuclease subunit
MPIISIRSRDNLPEVSGIYKVIDFSSNKEVIYVGQSKNIRDRWKNHEQLAKFWEDGRDLNSLFIEWIEVVEENLNSAESLAIRFYKPKYNKRPGYLI